MPLKLCTFNCRGIQDHVKRRKIFHYLRVIDCDIIFLQETHSSVNDEKMWKSQWGEHIWFLSGSSTSKGVAILIRKSVSLEFHSEIRDPNGRFLIVSVKINGLAVVLVNIYAPNNDPEFFLDVFAKVDQLDCSSLIVGGDFNAVLGPLDYQGTRHHHSNINVSKTISLLMEEFDLCDIWRNFHPNLRQYTRHQRIPKVLSRLDFILVSENLVPNCLNSKIFPGIQSDHSIVSLQFNDGQPQKGPGFWKLNCHFLHNDADFVQLIKSKISEFKDIHQNTESNPNVIWDALKCTITGVCMEYGARKKKERKAEKAKLMEEIEKAKIELNESSSADSSTTHLDNLESELNKILDLETKGLMIRSRKRWMEHGEKSSNYFCNLEKRSGAKKNIYRLNNDDGSSISGDVMSEIHSFFQALYSSQINVSNDNIVHYLDAIDIPKLGDESKTFLDHPLSKSELYNTIVSMNHNKTPGFDGLPVEFYVVFWADISDMLVNSYNYSLDNGQMSLSQRNGIITLLPKKDKDLLLIKNYRPISLLTVDYKIIAKTLANRLKRFLSGLIDPDQSGFLKGRNIGSNIRLIMDVIEYTECNETPGAILFLDIEKAFDSVSHDFLLQILKYFNFGDNFISWVKTLYTNRKSYVLNNGFLSQSINMNNGIFQGCPISPYLFLLVIETMALVIRQDSNIKGIPIGQKELKISQFADDSTCFLDGSLDSFTYLFENLDKFSNCSGCKINLKKSEAIWIGAKRGSLYFPMLDRGLVWKTNNFKTLGIHFSLNSNSMFDLNYKVKGSRMGRSDKVSLWCVALLINTRFRFFV